MRLIALLLLLFSVLAHAQLPAPGTPGAPDDPRYCGEPAREALKPGATTKPRIKRSRAELRRFVAVFPCPATLEHSYSCAGYAINHSIPLASGGCDSVINMTWMSDETKSCAKDTCNDRWERKYHGLPRQAVPVNSESEEFAWE